MSKRTGARCGEAEAFRLKGEELLAAEPSSNEEPEACFRAAIEVTREQSSKSWELRATMSLARGCWTSEDIATMRA